MGSIMAAIELQDNFTGILMNVINAVNMSVSTMEQMQSVMNEPIDTAAIQGIRDQLNQATLAAQELDATMQGMNVQPVSPMLSTSEFQNDRIQIEVDPVMAQQPQLDIPDGITVDISMDGISESEQQIMEISNRLNHVMQMQEAIGNVAQSVYILPENTTKDIGNVNREISRMQAAIEFLQTNPFQLDSSIVDLQIQSMLDSLDEVAEKQRQIDGYMGNLASHSAQIDVNSLIDQRQVPVEVPIVWQSDTLDVFTNTGIERFEMEVQSTNNMLNTLNDTQAQIAARAAQANIFPSNMTADMEGIQNRLQAIQERIQVIENNPMNMGADAVNAELEQLRSQLNQAVQEQQNLNQAVDNLDVQAANEAYLRLSQTIGNTERHIRDNVDEQGMFNRAVEQGTDQANEMMQAIKGAIAAYATIQTAGQAINLSDTMAQMRARLSMLVDVDDGGSVAELQDMIFLSAERSRGAYQATADAVSKLGLMAGDAFSGNEEIIAFMEQINKQFRIAGTEVAGIDAAMLQLTQAMGSGVLRGEEYNSILEQAPNIIQNIAKYIEANEEVLQSVANEMEMNVDDLAGNVQKNLKDIASEGIISAELVKAAMFAAADETNAKFESMPMTFEQIGTSFQNTALMAFQPVLERMNEIANSESFQELANSAIVMLSVVAGSALEIFDLLISGAQLIADNWSWLSPIIYGVAGALAVYYGWLLLTKGAEMASAAAEGVMAVWEGIHAAAIWATTGATWAEVTAQNGLNAAMYACPVVWIIALIIALVAAFYAAVAAVNHFAGTSVSATGLIAGAFAILGAHIINTFVVPTWNGFASLANFFGNVFNNPVAAIKVLFYDMCLTVIGYIQNLASAIETLINKIPGVTVDITSGLDSFYSGLEQAQQAVKDESGWVEYVQKMDFIDYKAAASAGYSFGATAGESIANFDPASLFNVDIPRAGDYPDLSNYGADAGIEGLGGIGNDVGDIVNNTGAIADAMDITGEELKYLRDIAEQEVVNRFTTAEIKIEQTNHNNIKSGNDLDGIVSGLTDAMRESMLTTAEGVH